MNILFLTDNFPPERNAPATRVHEHARLWVQWGHSVTVITGAPNFPEGKVYPGYKNKWRVVETLDGIRVVRVKTFITANSGLVLRTLDYISFMLSALFFGLWEKRPDVIVATSPQFFTSISGWLLSRMRGVPWIFELRDLWPASIVAVSAMREGALVRWLERLELFLYRKADAIVPVTHTFKKDLIRRGVPANKIHVVLNGVSQDRYSPREKNPRLLRELDLEKKFVIGYIGTLGMAHGLDSVLQVAERLQRNPRFHFLFVGPGSAREGLIKKSRQLGLSNVTFVPSQPKEFMPEYWSLCDLALVHLKNDPVFETVIPSKIFEAMGMGLPILAAIPQGEAASIVEETGAGVAIPPEDPERFVRTLTLLCENPERMQRHARASRDASAGFSREQFANQMIDVCRGVAGAVAERKPAAATSIEAKYSLKK